MAQLIDICELVKEKSGFDFTGYRANMLQRRLKKRLFATATENYTDYYNYILENKVELENIIDVLTINVSHFFRTPLVYEVLSDYIFPKIIGNKKAANTNNIRIWSAGCSEGQEPYSLSIAIDEFLKKEKLNYEQVVFATDIDKKALKKAAQGIYKSNNLSNVKFGILQNYFEEANNCFKVSAEIRDNIKFSFFDLSNNTKNYPTDSIYGGFDLVSCCNVLIYFNFEFQEVIIDKLYNSLNTGGFLILGESESISEKFKSKFVKETNLSKIYRKIR